MMELKNISKQDAIQDLQLHFKYARDVYEGHKIDRGLSKEGAFRRMQVFNYALKQLNKTK